MNTRHAEALAATAELAEDIRADIAKGLRKLVELERKLQAITLVRQTVGAGLVTDETRERANEAARLDRAAARGYHERRAPGLAFLNAAARLGTGQVVAPGAISAVSAIAEIHFGILHHLRRLARPALLAALEAEQTRAEELGVCQWPRPALVVRPFKADAELHELAAQLELTIAGYTSRPGLQAILDDLDRLEETALTALAGPASTNHPDACPWCGRDTLVVHHRDGERPVQVIRCEGRHECRCDFEFCACHLNPFANRHEWTNSGRATNTWHQLHNLQTARKEALMLETRAIDALEEIRALHAPSKVLRLLADCLDQEGHRAQVVTPDEGERYLVCVECPTVDGHTCQTCRGDDGELVQWPCPTYRLTDLDGELDEVVPSIHDGGTIVVPDPKVDES